MAIADTLYHRRPDRHVETWMPQEEILRRIADRFPLAVIDRERGDRRMVAEADQLAELAGPASHLVELHRKLVGRVAYVTIREEVGGPQFDFLLFDTPSSIDIEYEREEDREVCRPLLEELAAALAEYDIVSEDLDEPSDLAPDDVPPAVLDAVSAIHLRWEGDIAVIGAGANELGEPFPQQVKSRHWCDDGREVVFDLIGFERVPPQDLIEWVQLVAQTVAARGKEKLLLVCPPGTVDGRLTKYFGLIGLPMHATLAEALAATDESGE